MSNYFLAASIPSEALGDAFVALAATLDVRARTQEEEEVDRIRTPSPKQKLELPSLPTVEAGPSQDSSGLHGTEATSFDGQKNPAHCTASQPSEGIPKVPVPAAGAGVQKPSEHSSIAEKRHYFLSRLNAIADVEKQEQSGVVLSKGQISLKNRKLEFQNRLRGLPED